MKTIKRTSILFSFVMALAVIPFMSNDAQATQSRYNSTCGGCHSAASQPTCIGCHSLSGFSGQTNKTSYQPGEAMTVNVTGSGRTATSWVRVMIYDQDGNEVVRTSGNNSGMGSASTLPVTLSASAPTTPGTYTWEAAWFSNDSGSMGTHGEMGRVTTNSFTVLEPAPVDSDGDGSPDTIDCAPNDASIYPGAEDICGDGIDQDCSGADAVCPVDPNLDSDGDGLPDYLDPEPYVYNSPLDNDTAFVRQVYVDFLNREPDAAGLTYWVNQLEGGVLDRSEVVEQYLLSDEFGQAISPVARLYFAYFNRIPDYDGLMYWVGQFGQQVSLAAISSNFAGSPEFNATYGSLNNQEFVNLVYANVLGRSPDSAGLSYWIGELDAGTITRGEMMVGFSESAEYQAMMANQIYVTMTYMGLLRRAPDQAGFDFWVESMDLGVSGLGLISDFLNSNEYALRFTN